MMQFRNESEVLTFLELRTLEDRILFMGITDAYILRNNPKLTEYIGQFRQTIRLSLERDLQTLRDHNVRIISQPDDPVHIILDKTITEQHREKEALLANMNIRTDFRITPVMLVSDDYKARLRALNPDTIENIIELDSVLDGANMHLADYALESSFSLWSKETGLCISDIRRICVSNINLTRLPDALMIQLQQFPNLSNLALWGNALTTLPESFGNLRKLKTLNLWDNKLTTLPKSFGHLAALSSLDLSNNSFTTLPESAKTILVNTDNERLLHLIPAPVSPSAPSASSVSSASSASSGEFSSRFSALGLSSLLEAPVSQASSAAAASSAIQASSSSSSSGPLVISSAGHLAPSVPAATPATLLLSVVPGSASAAVASSSSSAAARLLVGGVFVHKQRAARRAGKIS